MRNGAIHCRAASIWHTAAAAWHSATRRHWRRNLIVIL